MPRGTAPGETYYQNPTSEPYIAKVFPFPLLTSAGLGAIVDGYLLRSTCKLMISAFRINCDHKMRSVGLKESLGLSGSKFFKSGERYVPPCLRISIADKRFVSTSSFKR
jgi:hypothetical protein